MRRRPARSQHAANTNGSFRGVTAVVFVCFLRACLGAWPSCSGCVWPLPTTGSYEVLVYRLWVIPKLMTTLGKDLCRAKRTLKWYHTRHSSEIFQPHEWQSTPYPSAKPGLHAPCGYQIAGFSGRVLSGRFGVTDLVLSASHGLLAHHTCRR